MARQSKSPKKRGCDHRLDAVGYDPYWDELTKTPDVASKDTADTRILRGFNVGDRVQVNLPGDKLDGEVFAVAAVDKHGCTVETPKGNHWFRADCVKMTAESWNPADFGEVPRQVEADGQGTIWWDVDEPPDPDDYKDLNEFEAAWKEWERRQLPLPQQEQTINPLQIWNKHANSGSSIYVPELGQDSHLQDKFLGDSTSLEFQNMTNFAQTSSKNDFPRRTTTGTCDRSPSSTPTSSQLHHPASLSQSKGSDSEQTTSETVSPQSSELALSYSPDSLPSKTCPDCLVVAINPDSQPEDISDSFSGSFSRAGMMSNGKLSAALTLERPGVERDSFWLESPNALSSTGNGRPPGTSRLEGQLKKLGWISKGEVCNPEFLEIASGLPGAWTNPQDNRTVLEFLAATQRLGADEKPSETRSTPELQPSPSGEFCTSIPLSPKNRRKPASGWLERYTENKRLKNGDIATYPRVEGNRDHDIIEHWCWNYRWEEKSPKAKSGNGYITRAVRVRHTKVAAVQNAIALDWPVEKILSFIKGEL